MHLFTKETPKSQFQCLLGFFSSIYLFISGKTLFVQNMVLRIPQVRLNFLLLQLYKFLSYYLICYITWNVCNFSSKIKICYYHVCFYAISHSRPGPTLVPGLGGHRRSRGLAWTIKINICSVCVTTTTAYTCIFRS